jgi:uncharacterized lipoprotein YajG
MNALIGNQINQLMATYQQDRLKNWINKATMINLLITASIGSYTYNYGATELLIDPETLY